jgi:hypothetical protein
MSHSYAQNHIHLVFSTKNREKILAKDFLPSLWAYTAAICKNHDLLTFARRRHRRPHPSPFPITSDNAAGQCRDSCEIQFLKMAE